MSFEPRRITWASDQSVVAQTVKGLDALLDRLAVEQEGGRPIIVMIDGLNGRSVYYGVVGGMGFVSSCETPYLTTIGDSAADGEVGFFFQGHPSPIRRRNLIPARAAGRIVREFFVSGQLPSWQLWEAL